MYNSPLVIKCYNSGFADDFSDLQGESVWEKRETSLSIKEVKELKLCQMSNLSRDEMVVCFFSLLLWQKHFL